MSDLRFTKLSFYQLQLEIFNEKGAIGVEERKFLLPVVRPWLKKRLCLSSVIILQTHVCNDTCTILFHGVQLRRQNVKRKSVMVHEVNLRQFGVT